MERQRNGWKVVQNNGELVPEKRWGHGCCMIGNQMVVFGGYHDEVFENDLWGYGYEKNEWKKVETTGETPRGRSNMSMKYDERNKRVIIFGGKVKKIENESSNQIFVLDWESKVWKQVKPIEGSPIPLARSYHTSEYFQNYLIVFGGQINKQQKQTNELWIFDFLNLTWKLIPQEVTPRKFHSSSIINNKMYIFGGCFKKYRSLKNSISLDLSPIFTKSFQTLKFKIIKFLNFPLLFRWGHCSTIYNNKIYIYGGSFLSKKDLNDLLQIDVQQRLIRYVHQKPSNNSPKIGRRKASICFIKNNFILFGGFNGEFHNDIRTLKVKQKGKGKEKGNSEDNKENNLIKLNKMKLIPND